MSAKDLHKSVCRGFVNLAAALNIPVWRYEPLGCYVLQCPAGIVTFPMSLIGELLAPDYTEAIEKLSHDELAMRLENPLLFSLPRKEEAEIRVA